MSNNDDLTSDAIRHLASLTRISMSDDEVEKMRDEMSNILDNIAVLNEIDTDSVEPTGHSVDLKSVLRDDVSGDSLSTEDVLMNAPNSDEDLIKIKPVFE
ncbi:MAG: Asp-tRNA(Asn)/Glu-tRNA(Gln) amidotransferase subunit GatC [SAR202 cluster bacterium]|nr:Asp-tRNA(Asn)/Glu-tRNA(Gln) amidotransferase subunit GatC [SAR202 cluster bacterium]